MGLEVFVPTDIALDHNKLPYAQRFVGLNGKAIGKITNRASGADHIIPLNKESLKQRYPDKKIVPYTEFPTGSANISEELGDLVLAIRLRCGYC
jgi:hypothetical protein